MKSIIKYTILIILSSMLFVACKQKESAEIPNPPFCISDTFQQKLQLDTAKFETVKNSVSLSGKIEANEDQWIKVYPVVGGVVEEMKVALGDYVKKGQVLAVIRSSEIADYQSQISSSASSLRMAEKNLISAKELMAAGLATEREIVSAEADLEKAKAEMNRVKQTNSIYGSSGNAIQTIVSPMSGYIIEKNVTDKMQFKVDGAQPFFVIANLEEVWVMANVFESDISKIHVGDEAEIKLMAYKDKIFSGKIDRIFNILDPQSRVMKVRIKMPNKDNILKPEMFAKINIFYDDNTGRLLSIPAQAVIFDDNKNYVVVYKGNCSLENREVELSRTIGSKAYINSGLLENEKVISKYQLLVFNALNK